MKKKTLKALKGSIKKWEKIVAGTGTDEGLDNCPLCKVFYADFTCQDCPVYKKTGQILCAGSPYTEYAKWEMVDDAKAMKYAKEELKFLRSLLPKK